MPSTRCFGLLAVLVCTADLVTAIYAGDRPANARLVAVVNAENANSEKLLASPTLSPFLTKIIEAPQLSPGLPWAEVQKFTSSRVPPMPEVTTVAAWEAYANRTRNDVLSNVVFRGEAAKWAMQPTEPEWLDVIEADGYRIRKLRFEAVPGMWIPALLYEPTELTGKVPVVLNVNGHDGNGKAADYKQTRCINQARRGMLALNLEWVGMGQLRSNDFTHYRMNQLDLCGTSGLSPFYLSMSRGLDVLLDHEHADPAKVAVAGLSGGGWQTIFISSLDTRVTLCNPVAGYSSFLTRSGYTSDLGDSEQTPCDLAMYADYAQLTALLAPRAALLTNNAFDNCCFRAGHALPPLLQAAGPVYEAYGVPERLRAHVNFVPGTHNFQQDNREALYRMLGDQFFAGESGFSATEIECADEVRTAEELNVPLPEPNAGFHSLAMELSKDLPRGDAPPSTAPAWDAWQTAQRERLAAVLRLPKYSVLATDEATGAEAGFLVNVHHLRIGDAWTVPLLHIKPPFATKAAMVLGDAGYGKIPHSAYAEFVKGTELFVFDPFYLGNNKISQRDFLYGPLVAATGERPLGIQTAQIQAATDWARTRTELPMKIHAFGPRTSLMTLCASAVGARCDGVVLHESLGSLHEVLEQDIAVNQVPEYFCFGLLQDFDIDRIAALSLPKTVEFAAPSERAAKTAARVQEWSALMQERKSER